MIIRAEDTTYPIYFTMEMQLVLETLICNWLNEHPGSNKVLIVTDENVYSHQQGALIKLENAINQASFSDALSVQTASIYQVPAGEHSKSIAEAERLWSHMADLRFSRKDLLIAFGGGMVGDLVGFCAATYLRGIPFIQVPTTLLSQIDSSVGGKVAINLAQGKNLIGQFYSPQMVVISADFLMTLNDEALISGLGEMIKYGLLGLDALLDWLTSLNNINDLRKQIDQEPERIEEQIRSCLFLKKTVVEADFREQGVRKYLNLGHTIGHAIEQASNYSMSHGLCVAQGLYWIYELSILVKETEVGEAVDWDSHQNELAALKKDFDVLKRLMRRFEMPISADLSVAQLLPYLTNDKKREGQLVQFVWPTGIQNQKPFSLALLEAKHQLVNLSLDKLGDLMTAVLAEHKEIQR